MDVAYIHNKSNSCALMIVLISYIAISMYSYCYIVFIYQLLIMVRHDNKTYRS